MKNYNIYFLILTFLVGFQQNSFGQDSYKIGCVGFYNLENLFDTEDDPNIRDSEFTPNGSKRYTDSIYQDKLVKLSSVIANIGTEMTNDGLAILGVCEVENRRVLEDLVKMPKISARGYEIVHHDSPDERGIDVGMIYNPKYFKVLGSTAIPQIIMRNGKRDFTRDVLHVKGVFDGDTLHVLVNHWPSRGGGEKRSRPARNDAAQINKNVIDSLTAINPDVKVLVMGDLNDDPISPSVKKILKGKAKANKVNAGEMFNPMYRLYKKGHGTLAYRDAWSLFDQILTTPGLLKKEGYFYHKARIYKKDFMLQKDSAYRGYPLRTFVGDTYMGGYSDHFPVYMFLVKKI